MSDPFDPVDDWLGTDIELLPPHSGAFERIHRRARRRKTAVALSTAAGAAVVIAAAAALPQLVSALQPGQGGGETNIGSAASASHSSPSHSRAASPAPGHSPTTSPASPPPAGSNLSISSPGGPPAPGITPSSVTFVSGTTGAVIGETTSGCPAGCEAIAATSDYGQTWRTVDPPPADPPNGNSGVSQIRFLEARNGWAYGPGIYVTHDGGAGWTKASGVHGRVIDLATVNGSAYAVVASCAGAGSDYASGCTRFALFTSPYNSDNFQPVAGASGKGQEEPGGLQLTNKGTGYLLAGDVLLRGAPDGSSPWQAVPISPGTAPACLAAKGHGVAPGESGLIAPLGATDLYLLCQPAGGGGSLYTSADSGATWRLDGHVTAQGTGASLAVAPASGTLVLATSAGIYYSTDARRWHRASVSGQAPAGGFGFAGMTTQSRGVAVPAAPGSTVIYVTLDGGLTWNPKHIR